MDERKELRGLRALVTGGSKGIGFAIARALRAEGVDVAISARTGDELKAAARELEDAGAGRAIGVRCDVRRYDEVRRMIAEVEEELEGFDLLVNNAGVGYFGTVEELGVERWDQVIETNLSGVFYCCHEAIPLLRGSRNGWIINIASLAGKNPFAGGSAYNASKFGLVGFSEALMMDVRHEGIRVNYIMPGSVSSYFGGGEPGGDDAWKIQPEDIGHMVVDLVSYPDRTLASRIEVRPSRPPRG